MGTVTTDTSLANPVTSLRFSAAARLIAQEARVAGLTVPAFRSPPRLEGAVRTLRRRPDGGVVVAVRLRDRSHEAVVADMVEGVLVVNGLADGAATAMRRLLLAAAHTADLASSPAAAPAPLAAAA